MDVPLDERPFPDVTPDLDPSALGQLPVQDLVDLTQHLARDLDEVRVMVLNAYEGHDLDDGTLRQLERHVVERGGRLVDGDDAPDRWELPPRG